MTDEQIIEILYANTTCTEDLNACTNLDWMCKFARALLSASKPAAQGDEWADFVAWYTLDVPQNRVDFFKRELTEQISGESGPGFSAWTAWQARAASPQPAQTERALTAIDADMVWPDYDGETFFHSIDDAVEYEVDQSWPTEGPLELKLQLGKRIPPATIRIFNITENGHEWEIVTSLTPGASNETNLGS